LGNKRRRIKIRPVYYLAAATTLVVWMVYFGFSYRNTEKLKVLGVEYFYLLDQKDRNSDFVQNIYEHLFHETAYTLDDFMADLDSNIAFTDNAPTESLFLSEYNYANFRNILIHFKDRLEKAEGPLGVGPYATLIDDLNVAREYDSSKVNELVVIWDKLKKNMLLSQSVSWGLVFILVFFVFFIIWRDIKYRAVVKIATRLEARYRNIAENMNEGVVLMLLDGTPIFTNKEFVHLTGSDLIEEGKSVFSLASKENQQALKDDLKKVRANQIKSFEVEVNDSGRSKVLNFSGIPFRNHKGVIVGVMAVVTDTTDKILAQREVAELSFILSQSQNAVAIIDKAGAVEWISDGFTNLYGYEWGEVVGKKIINLRASSSDGLMTYDELIANDENVTYEVQNITKFGKEVWVLAQWTTLRNKDGSIKKHIVIDTDISDLKTIQQTLEGEKKKAENAVVVKDRFLANMSHELRTPLNVIIGMSGMLDAKLGDSEDKDAVESIHTSAKNLLGVINEVLDFSKIQSGKIQLEYRSVDVNHLIKSVVRSFNYMASEKGLNLEVEGDEFPTLKTDPTRLNKVILNLIGNAVKFTHAGSVTVRKKLGAIQNNRAHICISVIDTGIGIPKEKLDAVFESFAQADIDTTRKFGGTGLGLSIVKDLVEAFGGTVTLKSQEGQGSEFELNFDFELGKDNVVESSTLYLEAKHIEGLSVLVVEDQEMNRKFMNKLLNKWGVDVEFAENGREALEKYAQHKKKIDLVLMDLHMPIMDGVEATKKMRSDGVELPIFALTADYEGGKQNMNAGFDGVLIKPIRPQDLYNVFSKCKGIEVLDIEEEIPVEEEKEIQSNNIEVQQMEAFNLKNIKELSFGDEGLEKDLVLDFLESGPRNLQEFVAAMDAKDLEQIRSVAHKLKQTVFYAGLDELSLFLGDVEKMAKGGQDAVLELLETERNKIVGTVENACTSATAFIEGN